MCSSMVNGAFPGNPAFKSVWPGEVIRVHEGGYTHWALVSDRWHGGFPMLISLSRRCRRVAEECWVDVVAGKAWDSLGFLGELGADEVLRRARSKLEEVESYSLLNWNCQHFAHWAHGLAPESPELSDTLQWALAGFVVGMAGERRSLKRAMMFSAAFAGATLLLRHLSAPVSNREVSVVG